MSLSINTEVGTRTKYKVLEKLGDGSFSIVYAVQELNGKKRNLALKLTPYSKVNSKPESIEREAKILFEHNFPNTTRAYDQFDWMANDEQCYVVILEQLQTYKKWYNLNIKNVPQDVQIFAVNFVTDCMICLNYFQQQQIVHRDLKLDNVMLKVNPHSSSEYIIKITDFNLARIIEDSDMNVILSTNAGNTAHRAPETFTPTPDRYKYTDIWAVGLMMRTIVEGTFPYTSKFKNKNVVARILEGDVDPMPSDMPLFFKSFATMCMQRDLKQRYDFVQKFLKDPELQELILYRKELAAQEWAM